VLTGIDHLVIAVPDPDAAAAELERAVGLRAAGGGRHERFGTFNRLAWLGDTYLELIGVWDEALATIVDRCADGRGPGGGRLATFALASTTCRPTSSGPSPRRPARGRSEASACPDGPVVRWSQAMPPRPRPG
jgi:hypothetical protein